MEKLRASIGNWPFFLLPETKIGLDKKIRKVGYFYKSELDSGEAVGTASRIINPDYIS